MKKLKRQKPKDITEEQIKEALRETCGVISRSCYYINQHFGISVHRQTLQERIETFQLEDYLLQCRRQMNDLAIASLQDNIIKGESWAVAMQLKSHGHLDGFNYGETEAMIKSKYNKESLKETNQKLDSLNDMLVQLDGKTKDMTVDSPLDDTEE